MTGFGIIADAMPKGKNIINPVIDLVIGLWKRSDRDFSKKSARNAFRDTCQAVLRGEIVDIPEPAEDTPHDSAEWARYVASCDCKGLAKIVQEMSEMSSEGMDRLLLPSSDDSDIEGDMIEGFMPFPYRIKRRRSPTLNPSTDKRFKDNKTQEQLDSQRKRLEFARTKAKEVYDATHGIAPQDMLSAPLDVESDVVEEFSTDKSEESTDINYVEKREKNSRPQKVPLPPLPTDYRLENEWIRTNIKTPDMLYSYVRAKAGDGVRWSNGLRKYYDSNDFWEFAFDTLSSGGWCDSENNRPICNVSKYITKATIGEYERHEASKHSRFEGRFKNGAELLDFIEVQCHGMRCEYKTEEFCSWFLQKMNDIGWRWSNGTTINNIPAQMDKMYPEFKEWCANNSANLAGLNPDQYGETLRIQTAIDLGIWKPRANGKFCAMDLLKVSKQS